MESIIWVWLSRNINIIVVARLTTLTSSSCYRNQREFCCCYSLSTSSFWAPVEGETRGNLNVEFNNFFRSFGVWMEMIRWLNYCHGIDARDFCARVGLAAEEYGQRTKTYVNYDSLAEVMVVWNWFKQRNFPFFRVGIVILTANFR